MKLPQSLSSMMTKSLMKDTLFALPGLEHCSLRGSGKDMNEAAEVVFLSGSACDPSVLAVTGHAGGLLLM